MFRRLHPISRSPRPVDLFGESERNRAKRDFWTFAGSGMAGVALLVLGVVAAAIAGFIAQKHHLNALPTAGWAVLGGLGVPVVVFYLPTLAYFWRRTLKLQLDEARGEVRRAHGELRKATSRASSRPQMGDVRMATGVERAPILGNEGTNLAASAMPWFRLSGVLARMTSRNGSRSFR
jgi:hypothetical protein